MPCIQFLRRCVVETVSTPPEVIRARQEQRRADEANGPAAVPVAQVRTWLNSYRAGARYGFDRGDVVSVTYCCAVGIVYFCIVTGAAAGRPGPGVRSLPVKKAPNNRARRAERVGGGLG